MREWRPEVPGNEADPHQAPPAFRGSPTACRDPALEILEARFSPPDVQIIGRIKGAFHLEGKTASTLGDILRDISYKHLFKRILQDVAVNGSSKTIAINRNYYSIILLILP